VPQPGSPDFVEHSTWFATREARIARDERQATSFILNLPRLRLANAKLRSSNSGERKGKSFGAEAFAASRDKRRIQGHPFAYSREMLCSRAQQETGGQADALVAG
jgi:hypothetical protein